LALAPDNAQACSNLGNALVSLKRFDEAVASCRRALEINPDFFEAHCNLGNALLNLGQFDKALSCFVRAQEIKVDSARAQSSLLFLRNYLASQTASILVAEARRFGELAALDARTHTDWYSHSDPERRLRIGFVSGDLGNHPVGYFFESMLARLAIGPADWLELIAYPSFIREDEVATRIRSHCHGWHSAVGSSDEKLAQRIRDDGIDILIDLSGHTAHNRLSMFAWKPAPIQVSWLGYFATTGLAEMDYLLADPWTVPVGEEFHFTETIWRMPETYLCFSPPELDLRVGPLPALASRVITFSCFNNLAKMNDAVVALWARVLQAVPESCLFLKTGQLEAANMRQSVAQRFAEHGIDAARLVLEGPSPRAELLAAYNRVDIALDPFPYPGGTTSAEALWMGVPVLTLEGDRFLSHIGESILQNAGLPDWIAADADDYVARAVAHARDIPRLAELRHGLRQQVLASPLFDAPRFARHFETALRGMWAHWCQQQQENQS
jgi:predicted O-linked N-acetylglucosamine transferase (SPINDLY family)